MIMGSTDQVVASIDSSSQRTLVQLNSASAFLYMPSTLYEITKRYIEDEFGFVYTYTNPSCICKYNPLYNFKEFLGERAGMMFIKYVLTSTEV